MKHEFKKITKGTETRYVLDEFATGGSSSAASIASLPTSSGGVHRRAGDNLLAQEADTVKVPVKQKPRQGVLRTQTGAGAHRDKKKEQKQGKAKHKKPYMEELKGKLETLKSKVAEGEYIKRGNPKAYDADVRAATSGFGRPADHRGLGQELAHERNNVGIWIDGKLWKVLDGSSYQGAYEYAMKGAQRIKTSIELNAQNKGRPVPKVEVGATAANPTAESIAKDSGISKDTETKFHAKLDKLVHNTFGKRDDEVEEDNLEEKAPPGMEDEVLRLKKQYPGHPEKAFATAWMIYNRKHGKKEEGVAEDAYMESLFKKLEERTKK